MQGVSSYDRRRCLTLTGCFIHPLRLNAGVYSVADDDCVFAYNHTASRLIAHPNHYSS